MNAKKKELLTINAEFVFGDMVYLKANPDILGIVIDLRLQPGQIVKYGVNWCSGYYDTHHGFEIDEVLEA